MFWEETQANATIPTASLIYKHLVEREPWLSLLFCICASYASVYCK